MAVQVYGGPLPRLVRPRLVRPRLGFFPLFDAVAWAIAVIVAIWLRYEFSFDTAHWRDVLLLCAVAAVAQFISGTALGLYRGRFDIGSRDEVLRLASSALLPAVSIGIPILLLGNQVGVPRSTPLIAAPLAILAMALSRYIRRTAHERASRPTEEMTRVLIYGAGVAGTDLVKRMRTDRNSHFEPVGMIDDAPEQVDTVHAGVRVLGKAEDIPRIARHTGATAVVVAIGHADADLFRHISDRAAEADLRVLVMPPLDDILLGRRAIGDLREISIEDVVGRHPVETDVSSVAGYLAGKRVLVTGAGGSIGAELCRQIATFAPAELMMLDRDETALQGVQISITGHGLLDTDDVILADIRDADVMRALLERRRPQVVFHAAALKHVPMLEQYPDEAWKTNVLGTRNVLEAAFAAGVETFVNISTDKAVNPTTVLGHSKQHAERLTASFANRGRGRYLSVRFGNVLGSRGSMVPVFTALIEAGGPLTITHPDITRYFMTIPEACQLVLQAGGIGRPGEVLILDMGQPVRILDVAKQMIRMSGRQIEIVYTGLRPHEKLHEELIGVGEQDERPFHEKISHAKVEALHPVDLRKSAWDAMWRAATAEPDPAEPADAPQTSAPEPVVPTPERRPAPAPRFEPEPDSDPIFSLGVPQRVTP